MAKRKRIEAYGTIYHIEQYGRKDIFMDSTDKIKMLSCIGAAREKFDFYLLGYCIMNDHYHLAIKTHNIPISKVMQSINTCFGKYYCKMYEEQKSPFKDRYNGIIVKEENLTIVMNLLHNEPIYCDLADSMDDYPYTSHSFYSMNVDSIVDINYLLDILSTNRRDAIVEYAKHMSSFPNNYEELKKVYLSEILLTREKEAIDLDKVLMEICSNEIDCQLIKEGSKKAYLMAYKRKFIKKAKDLGRSTKEIGDFINMSDRAVRKHMDAINKGK